MTETFLSTARLDRSRIGRLADALRARGLDPWWEDISPAKDLLAQKRKTAFQSARCVVVVWSKYSISSNRVIEEATAARKARAFVPVRLDKVPMPPAFRRVRTVDLWTWDGDPNADEITDIVDQVQGVLRGRNLAPAAVSELTEETIAIAEPPRGPVSKFMRILAAPFIWMFDLLHGIIMLTMRLVIVLLIMGAIFLLLGLLLASIA